MRKIFMLIILGLTGVLLTIYLNACASPVQAQTFGVMADSGKNIYTNRCAGCHGRGEQSTAPALIGSHSHFDHFGSAGGLLDYIKITMPQDAPGSLSESECNDLVCFLLVENELMTHDKVFDRHELGQIKFQGHAHED